MLWPRFLAGVIGAAAVERAVAGHTRRTDLDFEGPRHPAPISIILASLPHTQSGVYSSGELARMFREP